MNDLGHLKMKENMMAKSFIKTSSTYSRLQQVGYFFVMVTFILAGMSGCSSIGPSTVRLSAEIGDRLTEMQALHVKVINKYFDSEREKIENFLNKEWEPLYLKNFLAESNILKDLQYASRIGTEQRSIVEKTIEEYLDDESEASEIVEKLVSRLNVSRKDEDKLIHNVLKDYVEDDKLEEAVSHILSLLGSDEPARMILEFAEDAHAQMLQQRKEYLDPLEEGRQTVLSRVGEAYAQLIAGQSAITGRLEAASKVSQEQDRLLDALGGEGTAVKFRETLAGISSKVDGVLVEAGNVIDTKSGKIKLTNETIKDTLLELFKSLKEIP